VRFEEERAAEWPFWNHPLLLFLLHAVDASLQEAWWKAGSQIDDSAWEREGVWAGGLVGRSFWLSMRFFVVEHSRNCKNGGTQKRGELKKGEVALFGFASLLQTSWPSSTDPSMTGESTRSTQRYVVAQPNLVHLLKYGLGSNCKKEGD